MKFILFVLASCTFLYAGAPGYFGKRQIVKLNIGLNPLYDINLNILGIASLMEGDPVKWFPTDFSYGLEYEWVISRNSSVFILSKHSRTGFESREEFEELDQYSYTQQINSLGFGYRKYIGESFIAPYGMYIGARFQYFWNTVNRTQDQDWYVNQRGDTEDYIELNITKKRYHMAHVIMGQQKVFQDVWTFGYESGLGIGFNEHFFGYIIDPGFQFEALFFKLQAGYLF